MREPVSRTQIQDYLAARARAQRYMRDSSPRLTKKGLAAQLKLEQSAFNKFLNGTIFLDADGQPLTAPTLDQQPVFFRPKWTDKRLARFIERVETECWRLGIANRANPNIPSSARDEAERLRVSKHYQFVCEIKDSAELSLASALLFWEVASQEAIDARAHLRATMCVNALVGLGDLVDRKMQGRLCTATLVDNGQRTSLDRTVTAVQSLIHAVHQLTGDPCTDAPDTKPYECAHKAHGYGGYDLFFLGTALGSDRLCHLGVTHSLKAVHAEHHPGDGHVANAATIVEAALQQGLRGAKTWAEAFCELVEQRLLANEQDPVCHRLLNMNIPRLYQSARAGLFALPYFRHAAVGRHNTPSRSASPQVSATEGVR